MATRRRARRKSILGNLTDVEKRLKYLEKRPAPSRLSNKVVDTNNIKPFAVATDLVQNQAVTTAKIADQAVETNKIDDLAVTNAKLAENAVQNLNIANNAVGTDEIANFAVTNIKLAGSITADKISTVNSSSLQGVISLDLIPNLPASRTTSGQFDAARIPNLSATKITSDQFDAARIPNLSATKITSDQFDAARIPSLDASKITTGTFGTSRIADFAVTTAKIDGLAVTTAKINDLAVTRAKINNSAVGTTQIGELQVTTSKIADQAVTNAKLAGFAVANANIINSTISGAKLVDNTITSNLISQGTATVLINRSVGLQAPLGSFVSQGLYNLRVSVGTGSNQVAAGNHTHSGGTTVAAHTHPASFNSGSFFTTGGATAGTAHTHSHSMVTSITVQQNTSSMRFKKDIEDYTSFDVTKLLNLKLKKFKYKKEMRHLHQNREWMYGYMAEELQEEGFDEVLGYDKEGKPLTVNYGLISVFTLELVKKQQNEIDSLREEIQRLKEKI
jgi:hypothetical protein